MRIWIIENRYRVLLPTGRSFGMDRYGQTYNWTYDPAERSGREITVEDLPLRARQTAETENRIAEREAAAA